MSLAARVCGNDAGLEVAAGQKDAYEKIDKYMGSSKNPLPQPGLIMCILCLFMWTLTVSGEINSMLRFSRAVIALPRGNTVLERTEESARFLSISNRRCYFVVFIQMIRLALSSVLLVCGALWLSYETDMSNLLLNAVALEFVLNVDELIFENLAPLQFKHVFGLCSTTALPLPSLLHQCRQDFRWRGLDVRTVTTFFSCVAFITAIYAGFMMPYDVILRDTRHAICGGELDFLYAMGGAGLPLWGVLVPHGNTTAHVKNQIEVRGQTAYGSTMTLLATQKRAGLKLLSLNAHHSVMRSSS